MIIDTVNPWTGQVDYRYQLLDDVAVDARLASATRAFASWSQLSIAARSATNPLREVMLTLEAGVWTPSSVSPQDWIVSIGW